MVQTLMGAQPRDEKRLQGTTARVTGATSNIGRAIGVGLAAHGAHVVISGRDARRGADVVGEIRDRGGRAQFVAAELDGSARASRALAEAAAAALPGGRVDVLVNSAGIFPGDVTDEATFDVVYAVNVKAPYFLTAAIAPEMAARRRLGHQPRVVGGEARDPRRLAVRSPTPRSIWRPTSRASSTAR
jgi:NAD(P)-dependent dehydrogenase (short-subunit alcohol dehydrogenase family)